MDIVLSSQTAPRLNGSEFALRELGSAAVRGKAQPVSVFTLRDGQGRPQPSRAREAL